jgi:RND family efflux transporter MFP subunit
VREAETILSYTRIRAPYDALITERHADPGTQAAPGMVLLTLEDTRRFRLEASVGESKIGVLRRGIATQVTIDALGDSLLAGRVSQILPAADPASRSFLVKVDLPPDARMRSGLYGRARFIEGERKALRIPRTAVVERGQLKAAYVVGEDHVARLRYLTLGKRSGEQVEVLSGLEAGERIVAAPGGRELAGKIIDETITEGGRQ